MKVYQAFHRVRSLLRKGEIYKGSLWAKGDGNADLTVTFSSGGKNIAALIIGKPGAEWGKYNFSLNAGGYEGDADFTSWCKRR